MRIAIAIYQFLTIRDYAEEGLAWMEQLLSNAGGCVPPSIHANALAYAVFLAGFRRDAQAQIKYGQEAAVLAESLPHEDTIGLKWALIAHAYGLQAAGDYETPSEPSCQLQLDGWLSRNREKPRTIHLAEVLATS